MVVDGGDRSHIHVAFRAEIEARPEVETTLLGLKLESNQGLLVVLNRANQNCSAGLRYAFLPDPPPGLPGCVSSAPSVPPCRVGAGYSWSATVPIGTWQDFALDLPTAPNGPGFTAVLRVGSERLPLFVETPLRGLPPAMSFSATLGLSQWWPSPTAARVRFDDVTNDYVR